MTNRVVLVTGATDGLGRALAGELVRSGATMLVHGRSPDRIGATVDELRGEAGGSDRVRSYRADFASLAEVEDMADEILASEERIDVLVNNAGIGNNVPGGGERMESAGERIVSADGHELLYAVNYLAGYVLTERLLQLVTSSRPRAS